MSWRYAIRVNLWWILSYIATVATFYWLVAVQQVVPSSWALLDAKVTLLLIFGAIVIFRLVYFELYRRTVVFRIEGFRFVISRGVIFKRVGSLPIVPFAEIYVQQDLADKLCFVYHLHLLTALDPTKKFVSFEGLSRKTAYALKQFISEFLSKQIYIPPADTKAELALPRTM
ncbi:MAG: hypothetical protein K1X79_10025 [Oligoflexia bacterium]|nr:hypothetical protein [Oligoflexia bacterium]